MPFDTINCRITLVTMSDPFGMYGTVKMLQDYSCVNGRKSCIYIQEVIARKAVNIKIANPRSNMNEFLPLGIHRISSIAPGI